jgi:hypothetical protein
MDLEWAEPAFSGVPLVAWPACQKYTLLHIKKIPNRKRHIFIIKKYTKICEFLQVQ